MKALILTSSNITNHYFYQGKSPKICSNIITWHAVYVRWKNHKTVNSCTSMFSSVRNKVFWSGCPPDNWAKILVVRSDFQLSKKKKKTCSKLVPKAATTFVSEAPLSAVGLWSGCPTENPMAKNGCPADNLVVPDTRKPLISNPSYNLCLMS